MKKTRFFLMALLLIVVLAFTGCGSKDTNNNAIPDNSESKVEQDVQDGADDVKDDADRIGDDVKDGARDAADDVRNGARDVKDGIEGTTDDTKTNIQ